MPLRPKTHHGFMWEALTELTGPGLVHSWPGSNACLGREADTLHTPSSPCTHTVGLARTLWLRFEKDSVWNLTLLKFHCVRHSCQRPVTLLLHFLRWHTFALSLPSHHQSCPCSNSPSSLPLSLLLSLSLAVLSDYNHRVKYSESHTRNTVISTRTSAP